MKKIVCLAVCLLMVIMPLSTAFGRVRLPMERGVVTDDADVLSAQTVEDILAYANEVTDETDIELHVVIVHFLDGLDAQTYANRLFEQWTLDEDAMLLLGAAGEDTFATSMGVGVEKKLGKKNAENLIFTSSSFSELFRKQQYDLAFGKYFIAFNSLLEKQYGTSINMKKLFADAQAQTAREVKPSTVDVRGWGSDLWSEVMEAIEDNTENYQDYHQQREKRNGNGMSAGSWIILAIIAVLVFGPGSSSRKRGRNSNRRTGCGCSPLGWIFSLFGLNVLIDSLFGKRR